MCDGGKTPGGGGPEPAFIYYSYQSIFLNMLTISLLLYSFAILIEESLIKSLP